MTNFEYRHLLPDNFAHDSKVWIYQSNRLFSLSEALQLEDMLAEFSANWQSHGDKVKGHANLFFGQFIILMADESATGVSGCSTDGSVRLIKEIEKLFKVNMFDRQLLAFIAKEKVQLLPMSQLKYALDNQFINTESIYFNNLVLTKDELENNWMIPLKESWLAKKITKTETSGL